MTSGPAGESKRIVFVINSLEGGGAERIVALLLHEFVNKLNVEFLFEVELVLLDDLPQAYELPLSVAPHVLDTEGSLGRSIVQVFGKLRALRPHLVVSHLARANFATVLCCRLLGRPCIIMEHVNTTSHFAGNDRRARISRRLVRLLYPRADKVIAVSQGVANDLASKYGVAAERLQVIATPFDIDGIVEQSREDCPLALPARFLVAVGRLTTNKNFALLLDAYARAAIPQDLILLGAGDELEALQSQCAALGIQERVHFPGFVTNPYAVMARAEAFVSSSNAEGFPVAASEAMVLGCPVIMTDCPSGPAELLGGVAPPGAGVVQGAYGLLTPVGDAVALCRALRMIDEPIVKDLADRGRQRMASFRVEAVARTHAETIDKVVRY